MWVLTRHSRRKALTGQIRGYLGNLSPFRVKCYSVALRLPYLLGTPATMRRQGYQMGNSSTGQRATSCQILRRGASALTESRRSLYPYRYGYLLGAAGKSLPQTKERAALRLPYPLGTPATMSGQALARWGSSSGAGSILWEYLYTK